VRPAFVVCRTICVMAVTVVSIADKLTAMKWERDTLKNGTGRDLVFLKASIVDAELDKLDLKLRTIPRAARLFCG
jgi:hypothetical protein